MIYILMGIAILLGMMLLFVYSMVEDFKEALRVWGISIIVVFGLIAAVFLISYGFGAISL